MKKNETKTQHNRVRVKHRSCS